MDTKIAMYKAGVTPMQTLSCEIPLCLPPQPHYIMSESMVLRMNIKGSTKHMWVAKLHQVPYVVQVFDKDGYFKEFTGYHDKMGKIQWVETIPFF